MPSQNLTKEMGNPQRVVVSGFGHLFKGAYSAETAGREATVYHFQGRKPTRP